MLDVLGLDLITYMQDDSDDDDQTDDTISGGIVPDGLYYMARKLKCWNNKVAKGKMQVINGKFVLLKGSDVCPNEGKGLFDAVRIKRESASIIDGVLQEDIVFASPTGPAVFVLGCSANGWVTWKNDNEEPIDIYRKH